MISILGTLTLNNHFILDNVRCNDGGPVRRGWLGLKISSTNRNILGMRWRIDADTYTPRPAANADT